MAFDLDGAKKAGYSMSEIADFLAPQSNFDVAGARKSGYSDDEIVSVLSTRASEPGEFTKGLKAGYQGAHQMGAAAALVPVVGGLANYSKQIERFDAIDSGQRAIDPSRQRMLAMAGAGGSPVDTEAVQYEMASPERRKEMRAAATERVGSLKEIRGGLGDAWRAYADEAQKQQGKTANFTDIEDVSGFTDWLKFNSGQGIPYIGASAMAGVLGFVLGGPGGAAVALGGTGAAMGAGDIASGRLEKGKEIEPSTAVVGAVPYAALEFLGPVGRAFRQVSRPVLEQVAEGYLKRAGKEVGKNAVEEFINEAGQEIVKDFAVADNGERVVTTDNLKNWFNAGMAGAASGGPFGTVTAMRGRQPAPPMPVDPERKTAEAVHNIAGAQSVDEAIAAAVSGTTVDKGLDFDRTSVDLGFAEGAYDTARAREEGLIAREMAASIPFESTRPTVTDQAYDKRQRDLEAQREADFERMEGERRAAQAVQADAAIAESERLEANQPPPNTAMRDAMGKLVLQRMEALERAKAMPAASVDDAAHAAAASPQNELDEPTDGQKDAGNYKKGAVKLSGLQISIENPEGSTRSGTSPDGTKWSNTLRDHYGYIKGVPARAPDKEHVDVFIKPGTPDAFAGDVYVVDQNNEKNRFDEPKVMIGFDNVGEAREGYLRNYSKDWKGMRNITPVPMARFKEMLLDPASFMKPQPFTPQYYLDEKANRRRLEPGTQPPAGGKVFADLQAVDAERRRVLQQRRKPDPGRDSLNEWLAKRGGVDLAERLDTIGDEQNQAVNASQWLFRRGGETMDELASRAAEAGYLTAQEVGDVDGGVAALKAKIRDEFGGLRKHFSASNQSAFEDQDAKAEEQAIMAAADAYGIPTMGLSLEQVREAVRQRDETEAALEEAEADREARLEREAIQAENLTPEHDDADPDLDTAEQGTDAGQEAAGRSDADFGEQPGQDNAAEVEAGAREPAQGDRAADAQRPDQDEAGALKPVAVDEAALKTYAQKLVDAGDVLAVHLVGSATVSDAPRDVDILYELKPGLATAEDVEAAVEGIAGLDLDRFDTFIQSGDRYFHVQAGAGREIVANDEYAEEQAGKPRVTLAKSDRPALELTAQSEQDLEAKEKQAAEGNAEERAAATRDRDDAILTPPAGTAPPRDAAEQKVPTQQNGLFAVAEALTNAGEQIRRALSGEQPAAAERIDDVGEKIGGARKDTAVSTGPKRAAAESEDPGWRRRYEVNQIVQSTRPEQNGRWVVYDKRSKDWTGQAKQVGRDTYATKEEAEAIIPLMAVARNHTATMKYGGGEDAKYIIVRNVTERKRVQVVEQEFDSRDDAMRYMAEHAAEIIETRTSFGEEILPRPDKVRRTGAERRKGDVTGQDFIDTFGFRGVEFGNWEAQDERQAVMNHAYDALMDLADVIGIPARAIGMDGELALAFGARGHGLQGARAHYELDYGVINLTKMKGAGSLAHEWFHALDHYFGRQDGKASSEKLPNARGDKVFKGAGDPGRDMVSHGFRRDSAVRAELRQSYEQLLETMFRKAEQFIEDTQRADRFVSETRKDVERQVGEIRENLARQLDVAYYKRNNKPASAEQLAAFDALADQVIQGEALDLEQRRNEKSRGFGSFRRSNDVIDQMSAIYKAVRGRSGFDSTNHQGIFDRLSSYLNLYAARLKMLRDANTGEQKTRKVPTSFAMEAKSIDQGRASQYWATPHEMAARAFQAYVEDRISEKGNRSDFLTYGTTSVVPTPWGWKRPFPEGAERIAINEAFDKFVDVLETKPTERGVAMFSRSGAARGAGVDAARTELVDAYGETGIKALEASGFLQITTTDDSRLDEIRDQMAGSEDAVYWDGKAWLLTDNLPAGQAANRLLHELGEHHGLEGILGEAGYARLLKRVDTMYKGGNVAVRDAWQHVSQNYDLAPGSPEFLSEVIGRLSDDANVTRQTWWQDLLAAVKAWLAKLGLGVRDENDVLDLLRASLQKVMREAGKPVFIDRAEPAFARAQAAAAAPATAAPGNRASWDAGEPGKLDAFIRVLQDKHVDTKRVLQAIQNATGALSDATDVYLQEELFHGRAAKGVHDFLDAELRPLLTDMAARGVKMPELEVFLHNRHAEEANEHIAAINPNMPDGGSGIDTADARAYLAALPAAKRRDLEALAAKVEAIQDKTKQELVAYGLEAQATIDGWDQMFDHYVPLQREDMYGGMGIGQGFSVRGASSKGRTGSKRAVVDILANIAMQRERAIVRGEKNRVALGLVGLAKANPNPDFWRVDKPPMVQSVDPRTGVLRSYVDPLYKSRDNVVIARMPDASGEIAEHSVVFNERDERAARMAAALKNLDANDLGEVLGLAAKVTRYFSSINTQYNPIFGVVNLIRDTQGALFNLSTTAIHGKQAEVLKHTVDALRGIYIDARATRAGQQPTSAWAQLWEEFQKTGGQTGYRDMFRTSKDRAEAIEREISRVTEGKAKQFGRAVFDWLSDYNTTMENAIRLAAYRVGKDSGMTAERAASMAKNLTVNFNRRGQAGTQAGALYAFFNASVQGSARLAETLAGPAGKQIIVGGLLLGAMQAALLAAAGFDDDEPPDFVRERNLILPIGGGKYLTLPMPLGLHILPNLGRIPTEFVLGGFREPMKRISELLGVFVEAFNPIGGSGISLQTLAPTIIDPIAALAENKDWTGKPIAREDFNKLAPTPGHTRAKDTASGFSMAVSKALNWLSGGTQYKPGMFSPTPDQIDYLVGQVTGGLGREAIKVEQTVTGAMRGEDLPTYKIPLLGRFYGTTEGQASQANAFYDNLRALNEHEAEIKGRRKAGEPVAEYVRANPESQLVRYANHAEREVRALRHRRRELVESGASSDFVKVIDMRITNTMRQFNERVRTIKDRKAA